MNFGFLVQTWPFCDAYLLSKKKGPETPFYSVFGVSAFWAKVSKKGNFEKPPKKRKIGLITEKLFLGIFFVLFFFGGASFFPVFLFVFFVFFGVFFGGFKGQVRWPEGPPHLALNPPFLFLLFFVLFCFFWFFNTKKTLFFLRKGHFCLFSVFLFLSPLAFFGLPLFQFLFVCLSVFFFSFFLPSRLSFLLSFGSLSLSLSFFFFLLCFSFMKGTTSKY